MLQKSCFCYKTVRKFIAQISKPSRNWPRTCPKFSNYGLMDPAPLHYAGLSVNLHPILKNGRAIHQEPARNEVESSPGPIIKKTVQEAMI